MKLNGVAGDHQHLIEDGRTSTMVAMWRNPPISSSVAMSNEYNTYSENYTWVLDGCVDWDYQSAYNQSTDHPVVYTAKNMNAGWCFSVGRTGRSGYGVTPDAGQTVVYDISWRTYPAKICQEQYSAECGYLFNSSGGGNYDKLQAYFIVGRKGGGIMIFLEQWRKRLYNKLIQQGAVPLGQRDLLPI